MKKKGNRDIPDFSRKRPSSPNLPDAQRSASAPPPAPRAPTPKPHSTSQKSGRRGA